MMKAADARQGPRLAWFGRPRLNLPARRRRLLQADVRTVFLVQVDNATPIVMNREKSVILGIPGTTAW